MLEPSLLLVGSCNFENGEDAASCTRVIGAEQTGAELLLVVGELGLYAQTQAPGRRL